MSNFKNPVQWLKDLFTTSNGAPAVTEKTALQSAPFWYGVNRISGNVGTLPFNVRRSLPNGGSEKAKTHPAYRLLRTKPNAYQIPMVFKQAETKRAIMWGNSRSVIVGRGRNREILPQPPNRSGTLMIEGEKIHWFAPEIDDRIMLLDDLYEEMRRNPQKVILKPDAEVLHIQGFGDGVEGLSLIEYARTSLQIALAGDKNTLNQNTKGFNGKVMLEAPPDSAMFNDSKKAKEFYDDFVKKHGRDANANEIGMLRGGVKMNVLQMSNRDAEFIEQLKFRRQEAALWLLLESILGDDSSVSYNSLEQKQLAYLLNCLMNWIVRWEQECGRKLLNPGEFESEEYFCKINFSSILRPDAATSASIFTQYIQNRVYNPNEVRIKLDENPYDGGDTFENPNITPGTPGTTEATTAVIDRIEHMLGIETKRVNRFIERGDTIDQIDEWYDGWSEKLGDVIENLGGDRVIAQNHCVQSLKYLQTSPKTFDLTGSAELIAKEIQK